MSLNLTRRDLLRTSIAAGVACRLGAVDANPATGARLGIISDELTDNLDEALDFISSYGLHWTELRVIWGKNIMNAPQADLDRAKKLLAQHSVQVSDIASPIFKWNLPQIPAKAGEKRDEFNASFVEEDADKLLQDSFRLARFFGTRKVRIFSYWRVPEPDKAYPYVRDRLAKAAQLAAQNEIVLVLENEHSCNIGTGRELGRILKEVNSPNLRGNWDAGNAVMLGEYPYSEGYQAVRDYIAHVHIKDVRKDPKTGKLDWAPVGAGVVDWKGQMQAFRKDGYSGTMSLETHYRRPDGNKVESTRESLEGLLKAMKVNS
jgi:sugar phosphate isomerase/epimerase